MNKHSLNILCLGAHPDDCDLEFGGSALLYRALGHRVRFVSMTNGHTGHYSMGGGPLARRRRDEAKAAARVADIEYEVLDNNNDELDASIPYRRQVIRLLREFRPHVVLTHRTNDYHPDHRAVGTLVQDASYTVIVPNVMPLTPALEQAPVIGYLFDRFTQPTPYRPTFAMDTDEVFERKLDMLHCHTSQMYEWLPYSKGLLDQVPDGDAKRRAWLSVHYAPRFGQIAEAARDCLVRLYGEKRGRKVRTAETIMLSEHGHQPSAEELRMLFPFFPENVDSVTR